MTALKTTTAKAKDLIKHGEYWAHLKYGGFEKSSVTNHVFKSKHSIIKSLLKLVKQVIDSK